MPIVDVELVCEPANALEPALPQALADALGRVFGSPPGRSWLRVRALSREQYAENDVALGAADLPVFVGVLLAQPPMGQALEEQVRAVTAAVAACVGRATQHVHVLYAPAAAGRQAFGGTLVR